MDESNILSGGRRGARRALTPPAPIVSTSRDIMMGGDSDDESIPSRSGSSTPVDLSLARRNSTADLDVPPTSDAIVGSGASDVDKLADEFGNRWNPERPAASAVARTVHRAIPAVQGFTNALMEQTARGLAPAVEQAATSVIAQTSSALEASLRNGTADVVAETAGALVDPLRKGTEAIVAHAADALVDPLKAGTEAVVTEAATSLRGPLQDGTRAVIEDAANERLPNLRGLGRQAAVEGAHAYIASMEPEIRAAVSEIVQQRMEELRRFQPPIIKQEMTPKIPQHSTEHRKDFEMPDDGQSDFARLKEQNANQSKQIDALTRQLESLQMAFGAGRSGSERPTQPPQQFDRHDQTARPSVVPSVEHDVWGDVGGAQRSYSRPEWTPAAQGRDVPGTGRIVDLTRESLPMDRPIHVAQPLALVVNGSADREALAQLGVLAERQGMVGSDGKMRGSNTFRVTTHRDARDFATFLTPGATAEIIVAIQNDSRNANGDLLLRTGFQRAISEKGPITYQADKGTDLNLQRGMQELPAGELRSAVTWVAGGRDQNGYHPDRYLVAPGLALDPYGSKLGAQDRDKLDAVGYGDVHRNAPSLPGSVAYPNYRGRQGRGGAAHEGNRGGSMSQTAVNYGSPSYNTGREQSQPPNDYTNSRGQAPTYQSSASQSAYNTPAPNSGYSSPAHDARYEERQHGRQAGRGW